MDVPGTVLPRTNTDSHGVGMVVANIHGTILPRTNTDLHGVGMVVANIHGAGMVAGRIIATDKHGLTREENFHDGGLLEKGPWMGA